MSLRRPKNPDDCEQLILELWLQAYPTVRQAYELKEAFYKLYEAENRRQPPHSTSTSTGGCGR